MKTKEQIKKQKEKNNEKAITLIALVVTIVVRYDKLKKYCNINSFLFSEKCILY